MPLRPYQTAAVNAAFDYLCSQSGNGLIVLPTGTGKSMVIADICRQTLTDYPSARIIIATHNRNLVSQNESELRGIWPDAPSGVYSAGLKRREKRAQILFCGIQSVYKRAFDIQRCDLLLIDEAHTISRNGQSMWSKFIADLGTINNGVRVLGLSATPYRMDSGSLIGPSQLFTDIIYEYPILEAIQEGYLCEVIPRPMATGFDTSGVRKQGGEWIASALESAVNIDKTTKAAVAETIEYGADRRSWLIFCAGIKHANDVAAAFRLAGISCEAVTSENTAEHDDILARFKSGELRAVTNNNILTTGSNIPRIDLIASMRPTESETLYVQMVGRGTRPVYARGMPLETREERLAAIAASDKPNCLLLDFAKWTDRHGPIDQIKAVEKAEAGGGDAPAKLCPQCHAVHFAGVRICGCGYEFPFNSAELGDGSSAGVLSTQIEPEWIPVWSVQYRRHEREGKTPSMRVNYMTPQGQFSEWVCFEHGGRARINAGNWHCARSMDPIPASVNEGLSRAYPAPKSIYIRKAASRKEWPEILDYAWDK